MGRSWVSIAAGLPPGAVVHVVREDPVRRGLLYAGTELGVFLSFDDGAHWSPLQHGLPETPIHDLTVHDDDLVAATHGRSFWILDNLTPLRQVQATADELVLYAPATALRRYYPDQVNTRRRWVRIRPPAPSSTMCCRPMPPQNLPWISSMARASRFDICPARKPTKKCSRRVAGPNRTQRSDPRACRHESHDLGPTLRRSHANTRGVLSG